MRRIGWIFAGALLVVSLVWFQTGTPVKAAEDQADQLLKNQEKILQKLDDIQRQLEIIRIRVS